MSDLDLIARLRPEPPLPTPAELMGARQRLLDAIASAEATELTPEPTALSPTRRPARWRRRSLLVAAVAAAAGVVAYVAVPDGTPTETTSPGPQLTAAQFLSRAANAALAAASTPPQAGQYVYSEVEGPNGAITKTWLSADGSRPGVTEAVAPRSTSGGTRTIPACPVAEPNAARCFPSAGYFPNLPSDPSGVLSYLNSIGLIDTTAGAPSGAPAGWENNVIGKAVAYLMGSRYLTPGQQAALYELMAATPGFQVVPSMTDAVGRKGVGVEWNFQGSWAAVIFDPTTYAYLGARTWPVNEPADPSAPYNGAALIRLAVVGSVGQS